MRINYIKTKNINSLVGETLVDFRQSPLSEAGLFAIVGPTGSGKSTLLDAICLALFNRVPRLESSISKTFIAESGSIITRNCRESMAEVGYSCRSCEFISQWSIAYNRNDNLNDYHMQLQNVAKNELMDLKKGQVPKQNEDNIGLNFDQFVKSMVLAQGEFAKFLKSKKSERSEMLERITGSSIYRRMGALAYEYAKEVAQEEQKIQERRAEVEVLPEEEFSTMKQTLDSNNQALAELQEQEKKIEEILKDFQLFEKAKEDLDTHRQKLATSEKVLADFQEENARKMQEHSALLPYLDDMRLYAEKSRSFNELLSEGQANTDALQQLNSDRERIFSEIKKFIAKPNCAETEVVSSLEEIRKSYNALKSKIETKLALYDGIAQGIDLTSVGLGNDTIKDNSLIKMLSEMRAETAERITELEKNSDLATLQDTAEKDLEEILETLRSKEDADKRIKSIREQISIKAEILVDQKKDQLVFSNSLSDIKSKVAQIEQLISLEKEKIQLQREIASLQERRHHLIEGQPCPLCGSLEHPYASETPQHTDEAQRQLEVLKQQQHKLTGEQDKLQAALVKAEATIGSDTSRMEELTSEMDKYSKELEVLEERIPLQGKQFSFDQLKDILNQRKELSASRERKNNIDRIKTKCQELIEIRLEGKQLRDELKAIYSGNDFDFVNQELINQWQEVNLGVKNIVKQLDATKLKLHKKGEEKIVLEKSLLPNLKALGHENISTAQNSLLTELKYQALVIKRDAIQKNIDIQKGALANQSDYLKSLEEKIREIDLAEITEAKKENSLKVMHLNEQRDQLLIAINQQEKSEQKLRELEAALAILMKNGKKWLLLKTLIGDKEGKKFNDFAQQLNLQRLIFASNKRLQELSKRYVLAVSGDEKNDDLLIYDMEMGGVGRSVHTLSGGETFQLSLALALGLADMASRQVDIKSLFIDEGFGTLDPETLNSTIDMLEQLQMESQKTIGMITHVEALRERIRVKINVEKDGNGYSKVSVIED